MTLPVYVIGDMVYYVMEKVPIPESASVVHALIEMPRSYYKEPQSGG
jgi:hypothetical protein